MKGSFLLRFSSEPKRAVKSEIPLLRPGCEEDPLGEQGRKARGTCKALDAGLPAGCWEPELVGFPLPITQAATLPASHRSLDLSVPRLLLSPLPARDFSCTDPHWPL